MRALVAHAPAPVRWFVVDAGAITDLDYSAARSIRDLLDELARQKVGMMFARVSPYLRSDMDRHGVTAALGETRVFTTLHEAIAAARGGTPAPVPGPLSACAAHAPTNVSRRAQLRNCP